MNLENYTIQAPVLDVVKTRKNLTATLLDGLNLHNMKRGHEYWRLDTLMLDGQLTKFIEKLNDPETDASTKHSILTKHCTNTGRIVDWLADAGIPEKLDWRQRGPDAWSMRVDDTEIQLMHMGNDDYVVTQTLFLDNDSFYKQYITRLCTDMRLDDVKKKALDIVAKHMKDMANELETKANIVQDVMNREKPSPGIIFSTECMPGEHYGKLVTSRALREGIRANGYSEAHGYAKSKLDELKNLLSKDLAPFTLLVIENYTVRQYDATRQATYVRSIPEQKLLDIVDMAIGHNGYEYKLYADPDKKAIISTYTDCRVSQGQVEYRLVKDEDYIVASNLDAMLTNRYQSPGKIQAYIDERTESLYDRFEKCLAGTLFWPN